MPYFLDGNKLIGRARGSARPDGSDRDALVAELCERLRRTKARVVLFFDGAGAGSAASHGSLTIRPPGPGSADDRMLAEIARSRSPGEVTLVTSDRDLGRLARDAGARTMSPEDFWKRFGGDASGGSSGSSAPVDVADWLRYYEDERNRE